MKVIGHDDKFVQLVFALRAILVENNDEKPSGSIRLEQSLPTPS